MQFDPFNVFDSLISVDDLLLLQFTLGAPPFQKSWKILLGINHHPLIFSIVLISISNFSDNH